MTDSTKPKTKITKDQARDTGMGVVLLFLLIFLARKREGWLFAAMAVHVVNMIAPQVFRPVAVVWLGLSEKIGAVSSKVLLSIVYFLVVTPIGIVRRLAGKDSLKLRVFKASQESVMWERNHTFSGKDLEQPY
jgi:Saxitoxin biosynthesis operon protein SxtJ